MIGFFSAIAELDDDNRNFMLELYKNYYGFAKKTIFEITHETSNLEDLINDAFLKLIEKVALLRTFDSGRKTSYIIYTVRSVAINHLKHREVENKTLYYCDDIDEECNLFGKADSDVLIHIEEMESLNRAIRKLPKKEKDLLYFKYILEMSDHDISDIMGIASNSVRQYLTRARRNTKMLMEKETSSCAK